LAEGEELGSNLLHVGQVLQRALADVVPGKGAAKAAMNLRHPSPLVGDLHNPFSVKSLWRNAGHPQVTSALCHSALNIRPSPQNFVDPFRARFGLMHRSKQLKLFDHFVAPANRKYGIVISLDWPA
jgi:hypothetical protein